MAERTTRVRISAQVQEYIAGMEKMAQTTRETGTAAEKLAQKREAFQALGQGLTVVGGAMTALTLMVAKTGIEYNTLQQTSRAALRTLLGGAEAANAQMDKLDEFARTSPFSKAVFINAQQQLIGFGMAAERVVPTLDAIQNAVAATGGSNQDIAELTRIIAQLAGGVKISAETFNQFGTRGIDAAQLIGDAMGKTGKQIREEVTAGTLDADVAIKALTDGMSTRFAGAAANVKETFAGAMDRVKAAWRDVSAELMAPLVDPNGGGALIDILNWAADAMRAFQALPEPIKLVSGGLFALTGFVALAGGAALLAYPKFAQLRIQLALLGTSMSRVALMGGAVGAALAVLVAIVGAVASAHAEAKQRAEAYADTLEESTNRVTDATRDLAIENLSFRSQVMWWEDSSTFDAAEKLGISLDLVTDAAMGSASAMAELDRQLQEKRDSFEGGRRAAKGYDETIRRVRDGVLQQADAIDTATESQEQKQRADRDSVSSSESVTEAYIAEGDAVSQLHSEISTLIERINEANGVGQDAVTSNANYQAALEGLNEQVERNGTSLDQATASGSANAAALADLAGKAQTAAEKQFELDQKTMSADAAAEKYLGTLASQREAFINSATSAGYNKDEVVKLADQIFRMPDEKETKIIADTAHAQAQVERFRDAMNQLQDRTVRVRIQTSGTNEITAQYQGGVWDKGVQAFASGGFPSGIYGGVQGGIHKFAESEMGVPWETYISGRAADRDRNIGIWMETGRRLGALSSGGGGSNQPVQVSLAGAEFVMMVDGNPVRAIVQQQIVRAFPSQSQTRAEFGR